MKTRLTALLALLLIVGTCRLLPRGQPKSLPGERTMRRSSPSTSHERPCPWLALTLPQKPTIEGGDLKPFVTPQKSGPPHKSMFWRNGDGRQWSVLGSDGVKHIQNNNSPQPQMFSLSDDIGETNDLSGSQPGRAKERYQHWQAWNEENVPCRLRGYIDYHKLRDHFYLDSVPNAAVKAGYKPEAKGNFK